MPWHERPIDESHSPGRPEQLELPVFLFSIFNLIDFNLNIQKIAPKSAILHRGDGSLVSKYWAEEQLLIDKIILISCEF